MYVILVYDVDQKRTSKMLKLCRRYLSWIQNSVFEGQISEVQLKQLALEAKRVMENQGLISRVQSETDKRKTLLFLTEKAHALKGEYDSVSDEMGSIYYKGFSEEEITRFEECLDRIRKNLEEWQKP